MPIRVNVEDGATLSFDLDSPDDARAWHQLQRDVGFQATIKAITVIRNGVSHTIVRPPADDALFSAESVVVGDVHRGERLELFAHGVRAGIMVHAGQHRAARVTLERIGKPVAWAPGGRRSWPT